MTKKYKPSKRLCDIDNALERAIFLAIYKANKQRMRRKKAAVLLVLKHGLRGLIFSWPLYLLPIAAFALSGQYKYIFIIFLIPAMYVSALILKKGIVEDYKHFVVDRILNDGYKLHLLFTNSRW